MPTMMTNKKSNTDPETTLPAPPSAAEETIFGPDDITDPTLPLSLQQPLTEDSPLLAAQEPQEGMTSVPPTGTQDEPENALTALVEPLEGIAAPGQTPEVSTEPPGAVLPLPDPKHYEAVVQAFCSVLLQRLNAEVLDASKQAVDAAGESYSNFYSMAKAIMDTNIRQRLEVGSLVETLAQPMIQQGLLVRGDPYEARIQACDPEGFPVSFTVRKQDSEELMQALTAFLGWLPQAGYTRPPGA